MADDDGGEAKVASTITWQQAAIEKEAATGGVCMCMSVCSASGVCVDYVRYLVAVWATR
jgi:hypothetical protein